MAYCCGGCIPYLLHWLTALMIHPCLTPTPPPPLLSPFPAAGDALLWAPLCCSRSCCWCCWCCLLSIRPCGNSEAILNPSSPSLSLSLSHTHFPTRCTPPTTDHSNEYLLLLCCVVRRDEGARNNTTTAAASSKEKCGEINHGGNAGRIMCHFSLAPQYKVQDINSIAERGEAGRSFLFSLCLAVHGWCLQLHTAVSVCHGNPNYLIPIHCCPCDGASLVPRDWLGHGGRFGEVGFCIHSAAFDSSVSPAATAAAIVVVAHDDDECWR